MKKGEPAAPTTEIAGRWNVSVQYESGSADHKLFLNTNGNRVSGTHIGWAFEGELTGSIDSDRIEFRSSLPVGGQRLTYEFSGRAAGDTMSGELELGEYGRARWTAQRHRAG
jgi:L-seryl-tRNA(Ser) seleniumtransferase